MSKEVKHRVTVETGGAEGNLGRLARAWENVRGVVTRVTGALRGGKTDLAGVAQAATGTSGSMGGLAMMAGKLGIALQVLRMAFNAVRNAAREMGRAIESAVQFQSQTYQVRMLTGSLKEARQVMLQLTEGKQAVDHIFGSAAVVDAYRKLHNYTDGALASAYAVRVLGEAAMRTNKDLGSMADIVGRAWQMITAGEDLGRVAMPLMDGGLIDRDFLNTLQRMKAEGASVAQIWTALWNEIEERGKGSMAALEGSVEDLRRKIEDTKGTIRTQMGEMFTPAVTAWNRFKLNVLQGIEQISRNPVRLAVQAASIFFPAGMVYGSNYRTAESMYRRRTGRGFFSGMDFAPEDMTREEFLALNEEDRERAIRSAAAGANPELARMRQDWATEEAMEKRRVEALTDWRLDRDRREDEERLNAMSSAELFREAGRYGPLGEIDNELKHEQLLDRAHRKLAEEREKEAREAEQTRQAEAVLRQQMEEATFTASLRFMDNSEQAEAFSQRRDAEYELAQAALDAGDAVKQLEHELRGLQFHELFLDATRRGNAESETRRNAERAFFLQQQEYEIRQLDPEEEIRRRRGRIASMSELLPEVEDVDPDLHLSIRRRIFADQRRIDELEGRPEPDAPDHHRSGLRSFIDDLVNIPELANPGVIQLDGTRGESITERFASRLTGGQLTTSEAGRLSRDAGASAIERMQVELDNERNRLLKQLIGLQGVTD